MGKKIGIDLGTTYSCVCWLNENGGLEVLKNSEGETTTPSIVFFESESSVVVGTQARAGALFEPDNLVERVKSLMGEKDYTIEKFGQAYSPSSISSLILRKLKRDAEEALGDTVDGAVITCPAYFGTIAKGATKKAAEDAGLTVYSIINEPTAAAFAYAYIKNKDIDKNVLIYDLGGGTFDCTLLKMNFCGEQKNLRVIASNGDHTLGGKDWDLVFTSYVIDKFCNDTGTDPDEMKNDPESKAWFSENIEKAKKQLSAREAIKLPINFQGNKQIIEITRDDFDGITEDLLNKTIFLVDDMLNQQGLTINDLDEIILVGGSTKMPQVTKKLTEQYGKPLISFEPDEAVAKGAALMAAFSYAVDENPEVTDGADPVETNNSGEAGTFKVKTKQGEISIDDITNKSYGVKVYDQSSKQYFVVNLIKSGTVKPCSGNNQDIMPLVVGGATQITVCESDYNTDTIEFENSVEVFVGPLNLEPGLPQDTEVVVEFSIDLSGILSIKTIVEGKENTLIFDPSTGGASTAGSEQVKKMSLS